MPHSRGSRLSDFTKNGPLLPAEEKLRIAAMRGETCKIGDGTRPTVSTKDNTIRASFLRYLILGGCKECPIHQRGILLKGAYLACSHSIEFGRCLDLQATDIQKDIALFNCHIDGSLILYGASAKTVILSGSSVSRIFGDRINLTGSLFLRHGFEATGNIGLLNAKLSGNLDCSNSAVLGSLISMDFTGATIGGNLLLRGCRAKSSICANNATIGGNVFLNQGFQTHGTIHLPNAHIGGNIFCDGGTFHNKDKAIHANKAVIDGNVILGPVNSAGTFSFQSATIGGDFSANGATLSAKPAIELRGAEIRGAFHWRNVKHAPGLLDLGGASAKTVNMDEKSWQKPASIKLNNFTYKSFDNLEPGANSNYWKRFLEQQPADDLGKKFRPRPYEHLAEVLHSMGYEEEARSIRIRAPATADRLHGKA